MSWPLAPQLFFSGLKRRTELPWSEPPPPAADCDMDSPAEENMLSDSRPLLLSLLIYSCGLWAAVWNCGPVDERPGSWNIHPDNKQSQDGPEEEEENKRMKRNREKMEPISRKFQRKTTRQIPSTIKPACKQKWIDWGRKIKCLCVRFYTSETTALPAATSSARTQRRGKMLWQSVIRVWHVRGLQGRSGRRDLNNNL